MSPVPFGKVPIAPATCCPSTLEPVPGLTRTFTVAVVWTESPPWNLVEVGFVGGVVPVDAGFVVTSTFDQLALPTEFLQSKIYETRDG